MPVMSAGILLYRLRSAQQDAGVLIAHMGGPYWLGKDDAAWSIPKGEYDPDAETAMDAARERLVKGQRPALDALERHLSAAGG